MSEIVLRILGMLWRIPAKKYTLAHRRQREKKKNRREKERWEDKENEMLLIQHTK